jgi:hypothetical protein
MRSLYVAAFALLSASTAAAAQESATLVPVAEEAAAPVAADVRIPERAALQAPRLQSEQRTEATSDAAAQARLARGSFWWLVAVIVVAGVILAIVL